MLTASAGGEKSDAGLVEQLGNFHSSPDEHTGEVTRKAILKWIHQWLPQAKGGPDFSVTDTCTRMRRASPKYIPREEMLVDAYHAAEKDDFVLVHELHGLLLRPYEEHPEFEVCSSLLRCGM